MQFVTVSLATSSDACGNPVRRRIARYLCRPFLAKMDSSEHNSPANCLSVEAAAVAAARRRLWLWLGTHCGPPLVWLVARWCVWLVRA